MAAPTPSSLAALALARKYATEQAAQKNARVKAAKNAEEAESLMGLLKGKLPPLYLEPIPTIAPATITAMKGAKAAATGPAAPTTNAGLVGYAAPPDLAPVRSSGFPIPKQRIGMSVPGAGSFSNSEANTPTQGGGRRTRKHRRRNRKTRRRG